MFDYDLVLGLFVAAWLAPASLPGRLERPGTIAVVTLLVAPSLANPLGVASGVAGVPLLILPCFVVTIAAAWPALGLTRPAPSPSPQPGYQILRGSSEAR
jgi:hypothetical protein